MKSGCLLSAGWRVTFPPQPGRFFRRHSRLLLFHIALFRGSRTCCLMRSVLTPEVRE